MPSTIRDLTELTAAATNDYFLVSDTSDTTNRDKRISLANLLLPAITGGGVLATGGFTLTVPATGSAALLGTAQTFTALNTFSAGLNFGSSPQSTFNWYEEGTWTPTLTFGGGATGMVFSSQLGWFIRIGKCVYAWANIGLTTVGSSTGNAAAGGLPYPVSNITNLRSAVNFYATVMTFTGVIQATLVNNVSSMNLNALSNGVSTALTHAAFASGSTIIITATYRTG